MGKINPQDIKDSIEPPPIVKKLESDIRKLKAKNSELRLQVGSDESLLRQLKSSISPLSAKGKINLSIGKKTKTKKSSVLVLSDWHIGEVIEPDEIEEFNAYDLSVATGRIQNLVDKFCKWSIMQESTEEAVLICVGDMISGDIHEELIITNEFPIPQQIIEAATLLADMISELLRLFNKVRVEFIAADNHSRRSKKYQFKQGGLNSYNYLVGYIAQERLRDTNVEFNLHAVIKKLIDIRGYKYLCGHGHNQKSFGGIPFYGLEREVAKEARHRMTNNKKFHKIVIGHFHTPMYAPQYIMNGSLSGCTELDFAVGRNSPPCQVAWLVHPEHGDYNFVPFDL